MPPLITEALGNQRGTDQQLIAETGVGIVELLIRKNTDYGSSAWTPPILAPGVDPDTAMRVRMSDKLARITQILASASDPLVSESIDETFGDLAGYLILLLAYRKKSKTSHKPETQVMFEYRKLEIGDVIVGSDETKVGDGEFTQVNPGFIGFRVDAGDTTFKRIYRRLVSSTPINGSP